jgi:hypothetical protein
MIKRMAMATLAVATVAALAAPAAFAQSSGDGEATQVTYGDDVYGGTEGGAADSGAGAAESGAAGDGTWTKFIARLTGEAEVPGPGDPDASGTASVRVRGTEVCYDLRWNAVEATASHIHKGAAGKAGDIAVNFFGGETPLEGSKKSGCVTADQAVVDKLIANPGNWYVNVHSADYPKGAIRGQLAKVDATGGALPLTGRNRARGLLLLGLSVVAAGSMLLAAGQRRRSVALRPRH